MNETFAGQTQQPNFGGQQQPNFGGQQQPPTFDGQQPSTFDASQMPTFDGQQPPMQGAPMWGNAGFAGEEMLNGNNFAPGNFGAPSDLSGIVEGNAEISVNIGEQNNFANFPQGGMMPPAMFGGQGGQFNQAPQQAASSQAE